MGAAEPEPRMYVCICNAVTDRDIGRAAEHGVETYAQLQACTGCGSCCGCCETEARRLLAEACAETADALIPLAA